MKQAGIGWNILQQTGKAGIGWNRMEQAYTSLFLLISAYSHLFQPIEAYSRLFQSIPIFQHTLAYSSLFQPVPAYFILFQAIPSYSSLYPNPYSPIPNFQFEMSNCAFFPQLENLSVSSLLEIGNLHQRHGQSRNRTYCSQSYKLQQKGQLRPL